MIEAGLVRSENTTSPDKIKWSASSRTDKGVHSVATMFSAKIELDETRRNMDTDLLNVHIRDILNEKLPDDIRVLHSFRVPRTFVARFRVDLRCYEYLLPHSA